MRLLLFLFIFLSCGWQLSAQIKTAILQGKILDANAKPISDALVNEPSLGVGMNTKADGSFALTLPANTYLTIQIIKPGYKTVEYTYRLNANDVKNIAITMQSSSSSLGQVVKKSSRNRAEPGNVKINVAQAGIMPSTIGGIEGLLKVFLSGNNNELTSQYNVRGGNFDENLVYINDFEVYRPFLVRSGQQEGLSIINSDLVNNVNFSTGGFQAKYGDKMSSVLDVQYRKPKKFGGSATASLLGIGAHVEGISANKKLSYLIGLRQKSNQYLLGAQQTSGVYNPSFTDMQAMIHYNINAKWNVEILGNYARNRFNYIPEELNSSFGLINKAFNLNIRYVGSETDQFDSRFGGISFTNNVNDKLTLKYLASGFQTNEYETYDLNGEYILGEIETDLGKDNFGQVKYALGTGIVHTFARNYLTMNVLNVGHKGSYDKGKHFYQWGVNINTTNINDKLNEWERRDSAGFSQPASNTELYMARRYKSENIFNYQILSGFVQDNIAFDSAGVSLTYGIRFNYNQLNKEFFASPRLQASWKPKQWKKDAVLRGALGAYIQPPFYRELRDYNGVINTNVRAQKSAHAVLGTDYNFKKWDRPFKMTAETYFKYLWDIVPYEYDNVRIRYWGRNNAVGYATGAEMRLYGDIVKGAESWVSLGIMKSGENILDDKAYKYNSRKEIIDSSNPGYIPRPTDSRFTFGLFFQDYFPSNKNIKVHINGMYGTGLPFGPPDNNRYGDTLRLPSYKRVDMGFSALLVDGEKKNKPYYSIFHKMNSIWLSVEVFNLLGIRNTISYQWIQDRGTERTYAVPNRLTARLLNVKLLVKW
jgi:CarboxypepD_reg-like domain